MRRSPHFIKTIGVRYDQISTILDIQSWFWSSESCQMSNISFNACGQRETVKTDTKLHGFHFDYSISPPEASNQNRAIMLNSTETTNITD